MNQLKTFWQERSSREQWLLIIVGSLLLAWFWYALLWSPLAEKERTLTANIANNQNDLAYVTAAAEALQGTSQKPINQIQGIGQSVITIIDKVATEARLKSQMRDISRINNNAARTQFTAASFNQVLKFIYQLNTKYGIEVTDLLLKKQSEPGLVDVRITLSRAVTDS